MRQRPQAASSGLVKFVIVGTMVFAGLCVPRRAMGYSVLAHEANIDALWDASVNRAVPLMYPKLKAKFGNNVTYVQSPTSHVLVEFSFDVVQVAAGAFAPEAYHRYIGFKVAKPVLERAFRDTYGIEMKDVFFSEDLAIATYRHAVGTTIPEMTKVAWGKKRDQIVRVTPGTQRKTFVFNLSSKQYDQEFGRDYAKPHGFARFLALVYNLVPKIGPFRSPSFSVPTPEAERLFLESFTSTSLRPGTDSTIPLGRAERRLFNYAHSRRLVGTYNRYESFQN